MKGTRQEPMLPPVDAADAGACRLEVGNAAKDDGGTGSVQFRGAASANARRTIDLAVLNVVGGWSDAQVRHVGDPR
jgi:hypothetical protein